jgi:hypothetical protein
MPAPCHLSGCDTPLRSVRVLSRGCNAVINAGLLHLYTPRRCCVNNVKRPLLVIVDGKVKHHLRCDLQSLAQDELSDCLLAL